MKMKSILLLNVLMLSLVVPVTLGEGGATQISIDPVSKTATVGSTFAVDVNVSNVINMYAYEFRLTWNCSVVELQSAVRPAGNFMEPFDPANQFVPIWKLNETRSGDLQTAHFCYSLLAPEPAKTGSGILVMLTFRSVAAGSTLLDLKDTKLANDAALPITHSHLDGLVNVNPPPSVIISPISVVMDVGQSQLFTSSVSGGTSPFAYQWFLNDFPVSGATGPTWTFVPSSATFSTVYLKVTDNVGLQVKSNITTVTVNNALSVSISPTSVTLDIGQSQLFASIVSGGTSPFSYQWYLNGVAVSDATNATWTFTPNVTGFYDVHVNVTDDVSFIAQSDNATVTANPPTSVTISPTSVVLNVTQSQLFTSSVTNGTPPYTYKWYLNDTLVSSATSPTWVFTPTTIGTYYVYLKVADSVNNTAQSDAANITVLSSPVNVHDIALEAITNSKSGCKPLPTIGQNGTLQINVIAYNFGDSSESFSVIVYANATEIQRIAVIDLASGSAIVLTCNWSTLGFLKGNYIISAYAELVAGETNTTNNSIIGETVAVVIQGDINADGLVDIFDLVRVAVAFGAVPTNPNWDINADINGDRIIDIFDLAVVALNFGEIG